MKRTLLMLPFAALLAAPAAAWTLNLTEADARRVIDGVYSRGPAVNTLLTVDLTVEDGEFAAGEDAVSLFDGPENCLTDWRGAPGDFTAGSRPTAVVVTGQADEVFLAAEAARAAFRNLQPAAALAQEGRLPAGHLRVYVTMQGLERAELRDAYLAALQVGDELVQPVRRAFTNDWREVQGRFGGSMVYTFDLSGAGLRGNETVGLLLRTEADNDCAYAISLNLADFE